MIKSSDTRKKDVFLIKTYENPPYLSLNKSSAASFELTEEAPAPKQLVPCLAPSPATRKARAEMLKPTNGRESQAPAATLQWGPHGITPVAQPQGECWVSIQHIPNGAVGTPFLESSRPEPFLRSSPVIEQSWPPESVQATRVRAATRIAGDSLASLLASLNIRTLTDEKLRTCFEWMRMSGVVALALQETRTDSGLLMELPSGYSLFLGPCVNGTGPGGRPSRSRGCGWLVDTEWGRKVGIQFNTASTHSCTVTIQTRQGEIDLVSLYSAPSEAVTDEEAELAATCSAGRQQLWFSDSNADPGKNSSKSRGWSNLLEKAGGFVALNRIGKWRLCPTRYPGPNEHEKAPGHLDIVATSPMLAERLSAECTGVGGPLDPFFTAETDHRPVVVSIAVDAEWKQAPNSARKWKWDLSKLTSDPALRDKFLAEVETPLAQCAGRWKHLGTGAATQGQVDQAVEELKGVLMAGAEKVIGRKSSRVRAVAKPWWSPALTSAEKARKALFQQWKKEGRVDSLVAKARLLKAKKAYKALIRKEKRDFFTTSLDEAGGQGDPGRAKRLHQIFRRAASKSRAPAEFLGHRATLDYVKPKIRCTNVSQVAETVSLFTAQVSSGADREGGMDEDLHKEVSDSMPSIFSDTSEDASPITRSAVRSALKKLRKKIRKACGPDGITNWMLVWAGPNMISALLPLFSAMWQNNLLPTGLGDATLRYIPKGTKPAQEISGYRPISLTSCIGKLYTMVWLPKLTSKLSPWIGRHQGAFQKGTGALEQAWMCMEMIREKVKAGGEAHVALTDLEKCYDNIWREGLYFILHSFGVRGDMLLNIKLWVESTVAFPVWNGVECPRVVPKEGLKQGCVLSPVLCVAFMAALTCNEPDTQCSPHLKPLRKRIFSQGFQGMQVGLDSELLQETVPCLQFVDDCTMLAQSRQQMVELFMRYENFCSKLRVLVNWGKCSVTVFKAAPVLSPEQKAEQRALKAAATASLASLPRAQAKALLRAKAQQEQADSPSYLTTSSGGSVKQSSHCRVLGAHLHEHLGPEGAKLHVTSKVNQALPVTRWVAKNVGKAEALEHVRSKTSPSALFAAGIEGSDPKWVDVQWRRLMRASLGYEPDDGSCRQPPNVALEEQSGQLPWSQEVRSSNSSLLARLSAAQGPRTMPRELMASMLENGTPNHLSQSAVRFKRRKNKRARSKVASAQKLSVQRQRARCSELPQKSGARLYCELTPGRFPEVANKGAQFRLERQGVGLVPLPKVGSDTCTECGTLNQWLTLLSSALPTHNPERCS